MKFFNFDDRILKLAESNMLKVRGRFDEIDKITEYNQQKVLAAFIKNSVSEIHFGESTGYGYGDIGRETLDKVYADVFHTEKALVRHNFTCGTHALTVALFGILRPGDTMLCVTGTPYDTIHPIIGLSGGENHGSLKDFGVIYKQVDLLPDGKIDLEGIANAVKSNPKMVYIQRSRGYSLRPSLSVNEIGKIIKTVRKNSDSIVMVDNCYGEFVEKEEPTDVGADIMAGSLIKNAGGGIAKNGGYIAGRAELVDLCAYRLIAPGIGTEVGATLGQNRGLFMGFFNAPHVVGEAVKTAVFTAALFKALGFEVTPDDKEERSDIVQSVLLKNSENLIAFCQGLQKGAPVDSFVVPEPWDMPGYDCKVIMSAGTFIMGSSIELSGDAPLREPYAVWMQGGLNFHSAKIGILSAAQNMLEKGLILNE
ncbi:MAG: methionine gamma-lyase family protein [Clostridiales bacterium]|nr:methionine gamma-lyase family protein [Clostridiales bacterium]